MRTKITDGHAEDGTRVEVWIDLEANGPLFSSTAYGKYQVRVDGKPVEVVGVSRLRDGGTTTLSLKPGWSRIKYPSKLRGGDPTPLYRAAEPDPGDWQKITELPPI